MSDFLLKIGNLKPYRIKFSYLFINNILKIRNKINLGIFDYKFFVSNISIIKVIVYLALILQYVLNVAQSNI